MTRMRGDTDAPPPYILHLMSPRRPLTPLSEARARLVSMMSLVSPQDVPVAEAQGHVAAELVVAESPVPARPIARRYGIAVAAAELVGASTYAPAILTTGPAEVMPGDPLPGGADAVLPGDAVEVSGAFHEIGQSAYPGEGAVLAGADLPAGAAITRAGDRVTAEVALALRLAGREVVAVRRPTVALREIDLAGSAAAAWLGQALSEAGCRVVKSGVTDLTILIARDFDAVLAEMDGAPVLRGVAINPGSEMAVTGEAGHPTLVLAPRFDALAAALYSLIWPAIAACTARRLRSVNRPLAGKLVSQVGLADITLLRDTVRGYEPLSVGQVTLAALIAADAVAIVAPESEGASAGFILAAIPLREPFEPL